MTTMIGYLRVSTEEQANSGLGLDAQRDTIQRYADAHGWDLVWYEDAGLSAKSLARPQLQGALDSLNVSPKRRDVDGIVVAKLDRLGRSLGNLVQLFQELAERGVGVRVLDNPMLSTDGNNAQAKLMLGIYGAFAEYERDHRLWPQPCKNRKASVSMKTTTNFFYFFLIRIVSTTFYPQENDYFF